VKIRPVGAKLFYADGQTDVTKLIVAFRNFANEPKTVRSITQCIYVFRKALTTNLFCFTGFITETESVYCTIRPECWNIIKV